jgi:hypothetical protein
MRRKEGRAMTRSARLWVPGRVVAAGVLGLAGLGGAEAQTIDGERALLNRARVRVEAREVKGDRPLDGARALLNRQSEPGGLHAADARAISFSTASQPIDGPRALLGLSVPGPKASWK